MSNNLKIAIKKQIPTFLKRFANRFNFHPNFIPDQGDISWGDFGSVKPFSCEYGFDRGGPLDRYYIENFLAAEAKVITGNVLEIADNAYTLKYGGTKVLKSDVLHVNPDAPGATYVADLGEENDMPNDYFDCIILTQTLQFIYNYPLALKNCYRMLKKGGTLLITVPGISPIERGEWHKSWLWSFNESSINKIYSELFPNEQYQIKGYGNVYAAISFLHGIGLNEVNKEKLDVRDTAFDVVITAKLTK